MYRRIYEAVIYNSYGGEIARESINPNRISQDVAQILATGKWYLDEGYTIKIESHMIKYY